MDDTSRGATHRKPRLPASAVRGNPGRPPAVRQADLRTSIRPTVATVDLAAVRHNARQVRAVIGPGVAIYGVVKADAYGHGAVAVGRALAPHVDALAVSLVEEGLELREAGERGPIVVLGAFFGGGHSEVIEAGLIPVAHDLGDIERFAQAPTRRGKAASAARIPLHLKVDTGMSRLGVPLAELPRVLRRLACLPRILLSGLCTHFASADAESPEATNEQLRRFDEARALVRRAGFSPAIFHAANSAALARFPAARFGAVRPGLALYGALPAPTVGMPGLRPALSLRTRVMALHDLPPGTAVSYGGLFRAARPTRVATLPIGYADGYPRHVSDAFVLLRGRRAKVVGAVCMDMFMIDVTDIPNVGLHDDVTLIGRDGDQMITVDDLAGWAGTANYEILCGISKRVPRVYEDEAPARISRATANRRRP